MKVLGELRLRPSLPFTVLPGTDAVHLVAGEDVRYLLEAPELERWFPALFARLDGRRTTGEVLAALPEARRADALEIVGRLLAERVLAPADAPSAHVAEQRRIVVEGKGPLAEALRARAGSEPGGVLRVLCQDELDYATLLAFNDACLRTEQPYAWLSTGPLARGYVSPIFLPGAGPCLACLVASFRRLSPAPELYDALALHGESLVRAVFPGRAQDILVELALWKTELLGEPAPRPALYALHVLELASLEVSSHRVPIDVECVACGADA